MAGGAENGGVRSAEAEHAVGVAGGREAPVEHGVVAGADQKAVVDVSRPAARPLLEMMDIDVAVLATGEPAGPAVADGDRPALGGAPPARPPAEVQRLAAIADNMGHG